MKRFVVFGSSAFVLSPGVWRRNSPRSRPNLPTRGSV